MEKRTILVAAIGTSPAVLTETVWALAHLPQRIVPREIAVVTTARGRDLLLKDLLGGGASSVWNLLRSALTEEGIDIEGRLRFGEPFIHTIPDAAGTPADDLRTAQDNMRAADFMLGELRKYTESPDTEVLCSIAGGRKTMSALLFSCMSLLGREQDRVFHVLIPPEYECGMEPRFWFPQKGVTHRILRKGEPAGPKIPSEKISVELFDVPFVRMRGWYADKFKSLPPSYENLVAQIRSSGPRAEIFPEIEIDAWRGVVSVNGASVHPSATGMAVLSALAAGVDPKSLLPRLRQAHDSHGGADCDWLSNFKEGSRFSSDKEAAEDLRKVMSELHDKLRSAGFDTPETLAPMRGRHVVFPRKNIKWRNRNRLADVCGCLFPAQAPWNAVDYAP